MSENQQQPFWQEDDDGIDIKRILYRILSIWPVLIFTIAVGLSLAYIYNRYTSERFRTHSSLMIGTENNSKSASAEAIMTMIGYYNPRLNFENAVVVLESRGMAERTLRQLDFGTRYYNVGRIITKETYSDRSITVIPDSTRAQPGKGIIRIIIVLLK